jgi:hypothetical protein
MPDIPLHTRSISLRLRWAGDDRVLVEGRLLDLRKRAVVPLGAVLREPGVVHDMAVRLWVDIRALTIVRIEPTMTTFPYAPSPETGGETCPGRVDDVQKLVGVHLARDYGEVLNDLIGGPRGCFHIYTLLRLLGPTIVRALEGNHIANLVRAPGGLVAGERLLSASFVIDGLLAGEAELKLVGTLVYVNQRGGSGAFEREVLQDGLEARIHLSTGLPAMRVEQAAGCHRRLGPGVWDSGDWVDEPRLGLLAGVPVRKGFSARVGEILADASGTAAVTQLVFMAAPVVMQCMPSLLADLRVPPQPGQGTGTAPNSCHIWRAEGPLHRWVSNLAAARDEERRIDEQGS